MTKLDVVKALMPDNSDLLAPLSEDDKESMPDQYKTVSLEEFVEYSKSMFAYWTEDDFASVISSMAQEWIERR